MSYTRSIPFAGDPRRALDVGRDYFVRQGYRVSAVHNNSFSASGGGLHSSRQDPILGVTEIMVRVSTGEIAVQAELGGVRTMMWFLVLFPAFMGAWPVLMVWWMGEPEKILPFFGLAVFFLLIFPPMGLWIRARTHKSLEVLMDNMATLAGETSQERGRQVNEGGRAR